VRLCAQADLARALEERATAAAQVDTYTELVTNLEARTRDNTHTTRLARRLRARVSRAALCAPRAAAPLRAACCWRQLRVRVPVRVQPQR
jgi:hypothetical protein